MFLYNVGIIALALEVNRNLTWRDVQHLIVNSSDKINIDDSRWVTNGRGLKVHEYHGFGFLNAKRLVSLAKDWRNKLPQHVCSSGNFGSNTPIIPFVPVTIPYNTSACNQTKLDCIKNLEHVKLYVTISSYPRGGLEIELISPSGTKSPILKQRPQDFGTQFFNWGFLSVFFWDEDPRGVWLVQITQKKPKPPYQKTTGQVLNLKLEFSGTCSDHEQPTEIEDEKDNDNNSYINTVGIIGIIVAGLVIFIIFLIVLLKWKHSAIRPDIHQTSVGFNNNNTAIHPEQRRHHFSDSSFN